MSQRPRRSLRLPCVETLEPRQLLSREGLPPLMARAAILTENSRPDLDAFAWNLLRHPRAADRQGVGLLARGLRSQPAMVARVGAGTLLARALERHPGYAVRHHLDGLLHPPVVAASQFGSVPTSPPLFASASASASPSVTAANPPSGPTASPPTPVGLEPASPAHPASPTPPTATPPVAVVPKVVAVGDTLDTSVAVPALDARSGVTYTITPQPLPANMSFNRGTGELVFAPAPNQVGTYNFTVLVSDGTRSFTERVPITVNAPAVPATEVSGRVVDEAGKPLAGMPVAIGEATGTTDANGTFTLVGVPANPGPLSVGGAEADAQERQPLLAPVSQLLGHPVYDDADNVVPTPLILPKINWSVPAQFSWTDPSRSLDLTNSAVPGFDIHLEADADGSAPTTGTLSLAVLPPELAVQHMPEGVGGSLLLYKAVGADLTRPARLTLPNINGYQPGAVVNLLTVNMKTGGHDVTGRMIVSSDGKTMTSTEPIVLAHAPAASTSVTSSMRTLFDDSGGGDSGGGDSGGGDSGGGDSGGQAFVGCLATSNGKPQFLPLEPCGCSQPTGNGTAATANTSPSISPADMNENRALASDVGMLTGDYYQDHQTAVYQSQGQTRGVDLQYNSGQAMTAPIAQVQFTTPPAGNSSSISSITAQVSLGGVVQGAATTYTTPGGLVDDTTYNIPLQVDASQLATGVYPYTMTVTENFGIEVITSITSTVTGTISVVNASQTPMGAGWSVGGLQKVTLADSDGSALITAGQQGTEAFSQVYNDGQTFIQDLALATGATSAYVLANNGAGSFPDITADGGAIAGTAAADFDGDGLPDLAVAAGSTLAIRLNDGAGGFAAASTSTLPTGTQAKALAVGDFTGHANGVLDVAVLLSPSSGSGGYSVAVYTGNGSGGFSSPVVSTISSGAAANSTPNSLAAADLDGDGVTDLAFVTDDGLVDVLLASSGGSFTTATSPTLPSGHVAFGVTTADYNGDGDLDLVVAVKNTNFEEDGAPFVSLDLFTGSGAGGFSFTSTYQTVGQPDPSTLGLVAGYFQGADAGLEVAVPVTNGGGNVTYLDIVPLSTSGVWGNGVIRAVGPDSATTPGNIVAADFNGTGRPSIALTDGSGQIALLLADFESDQFFPVRHIGTAGAGPGAMLAVGPFLGHAAVPSFHGHTSDPSTLVHNLDGTWTRAYPDGTVLQFDSSGRQTAEADRYGNTTSYSYVASGQPGAGALRTITDPVGLVTTLAYDSNGYLSTITDPANRVTTVTIDSLGNLTQFVDPDGAVTQYGYDTPANHRITTEVNPNNQTATADYDGFGMLSSETLFDGVSTTTVHPAQGQGLVAPGNSGPLPTSHAGSITDPDGRTTTLAFTWMGHVANQADATGAASTITYDRRGFPAAVTDPMGRTTWYTYDDSGNVTSITQPAADSGGGSGNGTVTETIAYDDPFGVPTAITDFLGRTTTFTLDSLGNVLRRTDPDGLHEDFTYNAAGQVLTDTDRAGRTTTYHYDSLGRLDLVANPAGSGSGSDVAAAGTASASAQNAPSEGAAQGLDLDPNTKWLAFATAAWLQDDFGAGAAFTVAQYQITSGNDTATYPGRAPRDWRLLGSNDGSTWTTLDTQTNAADTVSSDTRTYTVATPGSYRYYRLDVSATNGDNILQLADLHLLAAPASAAAVAASSQSFAYDTAGNLTSVTDELGHTSTFTYDAANRVLTAQDPVQAAASPAVQTTYAYDDNGNLTSITDALGHVTSFTYNARNLMASMTDPVNQGTGHQTSYTYDASGNLVTVTDPLGHTTSYTYDNANRVATITDPLSHVTTYAYDLDGEIVAVTDPLGHATTYAYDNLGQLQAASELIEVVNDDDSGGGSSYSYEQEVANYTYDDNGNLTSLTDGDGHTTHYAYDVLDRPIAITDPLGHAIRSGYDAAGNLTSTTDPLGHTTINYYDVRDRLIATTAPAGGGTTSYGYDAASRLLSLTDAMGNTTSWAYDAANRVTTETDPRAKLTTSVYDLVGNLTQVTDRDGRITQYGYDDDNRPTTETWLPIGGGTPLRTITTAYDAAGRLTSITDPDSTYTYTYDAADRLTGVDNLGTPSMPHVVLTDGYDAAGNRTTLADNLGGLVTATYDPRHELTSITQSGTGVAPERVDFTYDNAGLRTALTRYSDLAGTQTVLATTYAYDAANRLTSLTHQTSPWGGTVLAQYGYTLDAANRLTQETRTWTTTGGPASDTLGYTYTNDGQLTGVTHTNSSFAAESFSYDADGNRTMTGYTTDTGNRLASDGTYNYTYDDEGNLTVKTEIATGDQTTYAWDHRNRLTEVDSVIGGVTTVLARYTYDALDRRIKVVEGGATRWTAYDGTAALLDFDGSGSLTARYLHGPAVDELLARADASGDVAWYLQDRLGTVRDLADNTGAIVDHLDYSVYGVVQDETDPSTGDRNKFAGLEYDGATGLNLSDSRPEDAATGRWLGEDRGGFTAGDSNLYRYVGNHPTNAIDPGGMGEGPVEASGSGQIVIHFPMRPDPNDPKPPFDFRFSTVCNRLMWDIKHGVFSIHGKFIIKNPGNPVGEEPDPNQPSGADPQPEPDGDNPGGDKPGGGRDSQSNIPPLPPPGTPVITAPSDTPGVIVIWINLPGPWAPIYAQPFPTLPGDPPGLINCIRTNEKGQPIPKAPPFTIKR